MISIHVDEELGRYNLDGKWNDYIGVQKEVLRVLREQKYFENTCVENIESKKFSIKVPPILSASYLIIT